MTELHCYWVDLPGTKCQASAGPVRDDGGFITPYLREAQGIAEALGGYVPSPELLDAMVKAAQFRATPKPRPPDATIEQSRGYALEMETQLRAQGWTGKEIAIAGSKACALSDLPRPNGHYWIYGFWVPEDECDHALNWRGIATYATATPTEFRVIQPPPPNGQSCGHNGDHREYPLYLYLVRPRPGVSPEEALGTSRLKYLPGGSTMIATPAEYNHPNYITDKLTRLTSVEAAAALLWAIRTVTGKTPSEEALAILIAQSALETGEWSSIHCFNFGNAKCGAGIPHTYFHCGERLKDPRDGVVRQFAFAAPHESLPPGTPFARAEHTRQTRFQAFQTAADGAAYHLRLLTNGRYAAAYAKALAGDAVGFSEGLHAAGYYTADPSQYTPGVIWRVKQCRSVARVALGGKAPPPTLKLGCPPGPEVEELQRLLGITADGVFGQQTLAAVKRWQTAHDLVVDGVVGPVTWDELHGSH